MTFLIVAGTIAMLVQLFMRRNDDISLSRPNIPRPSDSPLSGLANIDQLKSIMNQVKEAAEQAQELSQQGGVRIPSQQERDAIRFMVKNHRFLEAIAFYQKAYRVDLETAKRAIDKLMLKGG